ncbi:MAG TPA: thioredoxin family protein [Flavitalea sp.]|nr:thioredoxin family protein [Flavitalea sp.]
MRIIVISALLLVSMASFAQAQFEVSTDGTEKILKGIITRDLIATDTSFKWYDQNLVGYKPNEAATNALKSNSSQLQLIVFGGTWCSDTKYILPKFFALTDAATFSQDRITLIGVDRNKKTISHLSEALGVINVPTIIVMKEGKEIGRVVEYGKTGVWDKELGEIISAQK